MLTAIVLVNGKEQILSSYRIDTLLLIAKKFVRDYCVSDPDTCAKFDAHPSTGNYCEMGETLGKYSFIYVITINHKGQIPLRYPASEPAAIATC